MKECKCKSFNMVGGRLKTTGEIKHTALGRKKVSEWYRNGKDILHLTGAVGNLQEIGHLQHSRYELMLNGWTEILPVKIKVKCECK